MASILGRINWWRQVHGKRYSDGDITDRAVREIFSRVTPRADEDDTWDSPMFLKVEDPIERQLYDGLKKAWALRAAETPCLAKSLPFKPDKIFLSASDAATNQNKDGRPQPRTSAIIYPQKRKDNLIVLEGHNNNDADPSRPIAILELEAALLVVGHLINNNKDQSLLIILAIDSLNAKHWLDTLDSRNEQAQILV